MWLGRLPQNNVVYINDVVYTINVKGTVFLRQEQTGGTRRSMGRPPLKMKIVPVRLPPEVVEKVDALVGTYGRAQFIREAVERELKRRNEGN